MQVYMIAHSLSSEILLSLLGLEVVLISTRDQNWLVDQPRIYLVDTQKDLINT